MLAGQARDAGCHLAGMVAVSNGHAEIGILPPVELSNVVDARLAEPRLQAEADKELGFWVVLLDLENGGVGKVVVMRVADNNGIDDGDVLDIAGSWGVSLGAHEGKGRAAVLEDGIEEHPQT